MAAGEKEFKAPVPIGIPGTDLRTDEREIPAGEPRPWGANETLRVVGQPTRRADGVDKVTGAAKYTADVSLPGMLWAKTIASTRAHARIRAIGTSRAEKHPGFAAIHLLDRPVATAQLRDPKLEPKSQYPVIRYMGQPVGAVAAATPEAADEIARLVEIDCEPLPHVCDLDAAQKDGAPLVFPGAVDMGGTAGGGGALAGLPQKGNVRGPATAARGNVTKGFSEAEFVVEGEFKTAVQTHSAMETHGFVADWRKDGLTVYASTQGTAGVQDELSAVFGLPREKVRVVTEFMGGGFGAKFGLGAPGLLAVHLSKKTGRPVRLVCDRKDEQVFTGNRPATTQKLRIGAKKDGTLCAIELSSHGTAGVSTGAGVGSVAERVYECPNFLSKQHDVFINAGPGTAMRAPGFPQGAFALEQLLDELSEKLGLDPLSLRDRIDTRVESGALARRAERKIGAEKFGWARRRPPRSDTGPVLRGVGVAQSFWPRYVRTEVSCEVRVARNGTVEVRSGVQDLGTGTKSVLAQVVAEEFGIGAGDVTVLIGDTDFPRGPQSGGSVTVASISPAARAAAVGARERLLDLAARKLKCKPKDLVVEKGGVRRPDKAGKALSLGEVAKLSKNGVISATGTRKPDYQPPPGVPVVGGTGGVQFSEVAVDTETGVVRVERVLCVQDCGRPMNPAALESQVYGGVIQGISYALFEERIIDQATGHVLNADLEHYKIAGALDVPQIDVVFIEDYRGRSSTDAGAVGEPATVPTAASIANAFYNATGVRMREIPMTPARVLSALDAGARGKA